MKFVLALVLTILPGLVASKNNDVTFSGWGEIGLKNEKQNIVNGPPVITYYAAKLQAEIKLNKQNFDERIELNHDH